MSGCDNRRMASRHSEHDVVRLETDSGRWPAGTVGTIVELDAATALVEVADDHGHALDFISVPQDQLVPAGEQRSRAAS
jgi:hypothetical protein